MAARSADFAGSWYPGRESDCREAIQGFLGSGISCPTGSSAGIGGIVPHAGWFYSGKIACHVIRCLEGDPSPDTFILFGRHLRPGSHNFIMKEGLWSTPLGALEIDDEFTEKLISEFPFKIETASHYDPDNTIELQLPFIKHFFPDVRIVPIGIPPSTGSLKIGERIVEISRIIGRRIRVLGSTDLTHYGHNYGYTPKGEGEEAINWVKNENDKKMVDLMLDMDAEKVIEESLRNYNACCGGAAATAIAAARGLGACRAEKLIYTTSYDIRPDRSFVGYAGIVFSKPLNP